MGKLDAPLMPPSPLWPSLQVCTWACKGQAYGWREFLSHLHLSPVSLNGGLR